MDKTFLRWQYHLNVLFAVAELAREAKSQLSKMERTVHGLRRCSLPRLLGHALEKLDAVLLRNK